MDTLITLKYIHRLHQSKIHKLTLNNKEKKEGYHLTFKRQIECLKDTFCIAYRNGYNKVFFNSEGIDSQIFDATKENVVAP